MRALAIALALSATAAHAYPAPTCSDWRQQTTTIIDRQPGSAARVVGYLEGYLNRASHDEKRDLTLHIRPEDIFTWVDGYCRSNQFVAFDAAIEDWIAKKARQNVMPIAPPK
jgi:hypothetical protein